MESSVRGQIGWGRRQAQGSEQIKELSIGGPIEIGADVLGQALADGFDARGEWGGPHDGAHIDPIALLEIVNGDGFGLLPELFINVRPGWSLFAVFGEDLINEFHGGNPVDDG